MSRIRAEDTAPELALRRALWARGLRYRLHDSSLPGKPDLVFRRERLVVFVDGCFWHGCPLHYRPPKTRAGYWRNKVAGNRRRRGRVVPLLRSNGWRVMRFWEHQLRHGRLDVADLVEVQLRSPVAHAI